MPISLQNPHLHRTWLWGAVGWSMLFSQEKVLKLSHSTSQGGVTTEFFSIFQLWGLKASCQPQLALPYAHLESAGPSTGCSPPESAGWAATYSKKFLSWSSSTYQPSRLYILPRQSKLTGFVGSSTQQPTKPLFWQVGGSGTCFYSNKSVVRPLLSPAWHCHRCVQVTHRLAFICKLSVKKSWQRLTATPQQMLGKFTISQPQNMNSCITASLPRCYSSFLSVLL